MPKLSPVFLSLLSIALLISTLPTDCKPVVAEKSVWVVEQQNKFVGHTTLYVTEDAIKFIGQDGALLLVTRAPDWNVSVCRPKDGIGYTQSLKQFEKDGLAIWSGHSSLEHSQKRSVYDPKLKLECYEMRSGTTRQSYDANDPLIFKSAKKIFEQAVQFRCTRSVVLPGPVIHFLAALYRQWELSGIPIEKHLYLSDGTIYTDFCTNSFYKKAMPSTFFNDPDKFKVVARNSPDMWVSRKSQKEISNLLKDVMLSEPEK